MSSQKKITSGVAPADNGSSNVAKSKRLSTLQRGAPRATGPRMQPASVIATTTSDQTSSIISSTTAPGLQQANQQQQTIQYVVVNTAARPFTVGQSQAGTAMPQYHQLIPSSQGASAHAFNSFVPHASGRNAAAGNPSFPFIPTTQAGSTAIPNMYDTRRAPVSSSMQHSHQQWGQMLPVQLMPVSTSGVPQGNNALFRPVNNFREHANVLPEAETAAEAAGQRFVPAHVTYSSSMNNSERAPLNGGQRMLPVHVVPQQFNAAFLPSSHFATLSVPHTQQQQQLQQQNIASPVSLSPAINVTPAISDQQQLSPSTSSGPRSRNPSSLAAPPRAASSNANSGGSNPNLSPQNSVATPNSDNSPLSPRNAFQQQQQYTRQQQPLPHRSNMRSAATVSQSMAPSVADEMDEDDNDDTSSSFAENGKTNDATISAFLLDADDTDETFLDDDFDGTGSVNLTDSSTANAASRSAALQQFRERRRAAHLQAEKKRRNSIQHGFQELKELLPPLPSEQGGGAGLLRATKAVVLQRAISYCELLRKTNSQSSDKVAKLRQEAEGLEIMRDQLKQFVAQAASVPQQQQNSDSTTSNFTGKDNAVNEAAGQQVVRPSSSADDADMYFDVFRSFADALFLSYNRVVSTQDFKSISGTSIQWLEQYCGPQSTQRHIQQAANQVFGARGGVVDIQANMQR